MAASIGCSFSGVGFLLQNHYPRSTGAPSGHFRMLTKRPPSVDSGLGVTGDEATAALAAGALEAADASGEESVNAVRRALPTLFS